MYVGPGNINNRILAFTYDITSGDTASGDRTQLENAALAINKARATQVYGHSGKGSAASLGTCQNQDLGTKLTDMTLMTNSKSKIKLP